MSRRCAGLRGSGARDPAVDEAAGWLAILTDADSSGQEREAFVGWLRQSTLHVEEFLRISALVRRLSGSHLWAAQAAEELIEQARASSGNVVALGLSRGKSAPRNASRMHYAAAACGLLVAAALGAIALGPRWLPDADTYTTATGEMRSIVLPDGSLVDLNTRSRLRVRFSPGTRDVDLVAGEAIFRVAKDSARPFRVSAPSTQIVAIGTTFNVYAQPKRTVITVLEGRVRVTDSESGRARANSAGTAGAALELAPGEQAVVAPQRPIARVALADPARVTSWTERRLIFDDVPLSVAAGEFARYSARTIRIQDAELAVRHITGVFDATDPGSLVQFLATQGDVRIEEVADGWTLDQRQ